MKPEDVLMAAFPLSYLVMLAIEARIPARRYPPVRGWRLVGVGALVLAATEDGVRRLSDEQISDLIDQLIASRAERPDGPGAPLA